MRIPKKVLKSLGEFLEFRAFPIWSKQPGFKERYVGCATGISILNYLIERKLRMIDQHFVMMGGGGQVRIER